MQHDVIPKGEHADEIEGYFAGRMESDTAVPAVNWFTIVCFTNRCGSTLVCSALSQLGIAGKPNRMLNYEYFNADIVKEEAAEFQLGTFDDYVHHCIRSYSSSGRNFTTKLSLQQFNWLLESGAVERIGVRPRIVFVRRRNVIAQAVSFATAIQDSRWTSLHECNDAATLQFGTTFLLSSAKAFCEQNATFDLLLDYHGLQPLTIWYEDFAAKEDRLLSELAEFYGLGLQVGGASALPVERQSAPHKDQWESGLRALGRSRTSLT